MTHSQLSKSKPAGVLIFSGFNQRSIIAMCRTLEVCNITYSIIANNPQDTIFQTTYASHVSVVRNNPALDIDDLCACIESVRKDTPDDFVIAPTSEAMNTFLLEHRLRIEQSGGILSLVPKELYSTISDKSKFTTLCKKHNLKVPKELSLFDSPELPLVAKPHHEISSDGSHRYPLLLYTENDWLEFQARSDHKFYFIQQYIKGPSYYLLYYFHSSGHVDRFSMRNLVQQPDGKSIVAAAPARLHLDKTYQVIENLLKEIGFKGLIMLELMFEDNQFYMIEANPRMWGPAQLMVDAGNNLYVSFINDFFGYDFPLDICGNITNPLYFWWSGFWGPQLKGKPMKWHEPPAEFWDKYLNFFDSEIYNRKDTNRIFTHEAKALPILKRKNSNVSKNKRDQ